MDLVKSRSVDVMEASQNTGSQSGSFIPSCMMLPTLLVCVVLPLAGASTRGGRTEEGQVGSTRFGYMVKVVSDEECGGALVREDVVLTAAHCLPLDWQRTERTSLHAGVDYTEAGTTRAAPGTPIRSTQIRQAISIHIHDQYFSGTVLYNDIALVVAQSPFQIGPTVFPISMSYGRSDGSCVCLSSLSDCLSYPEQVNTATTKCTVAGWGGEQSINNKTLHYIDNFLVNSSQDCPVYNERIVCQKSINESRGPEKGDSGGPVVCNNQIIAIVSFQITLEDKIYRYFTFLEQYQDWIESTLLHKNQNVIKYLKTEKTHRTKELELCEKNLVILTEREDLIKTQQEIIRTLDRQIQIHTHNMTALTLTIQDKKTTIEKLEAAAKQQKNDVTQLEHQVKHARHKIHQIENKFKQRTEHNTNLEKSVKLYTLNISKLEDIIQQQIEIISRLESHLEFQNETMRRKEEKSKLGIENSEIAEKTLLKNINDLQIELENKDHLINRLNLTINTLKRIVWKSNLFKCISTRTGIRSLISKYELEV